MSRQELQQGFYRFDDDQREILIDRYDTPSPWMNYLSNGSFTAMLSQAGGGLAFYRSPQIFRLTRYRFFHLPTDRPGPYLYLRDDRTGRYWCPTCEPAAQKPDRWQAAHGMGYTRFRAGYGDLSATLTYFVDPEEDALIWQLALHNEGTKRMELSAFAYVEFSLMEFLREIQWQCYNKHQVSVEFDDRLQTLIYHYDVENQPKPDETPLVYFAGDRPLVSFDGDRDAFIGSYRSEANPLAIETDGCTGSTLNGGDPCGALQCAISLEPGERAVWHVFLGAAPDKAAIAGALEHLRQPGAATRAFAQLKQNWEANLGALQCDVPDETVARMVNTWNPYQVYYNALLSRNISYYATGTFRGMGFRDTAQDIVALAALHPQRAKARTALLLGQQYPDGHVNHYFFPIEGWDPVTKIYSDDHLWLIFSVYQLVIEEGTTDFLQEVYPFYDGGEATVYEHLRRCVRYAEEHMGPHGFPLMLTSDWNDALFRVARQGRGESIWTAMQLGVALLKLAELARLLGHEEDARHDQEFYDRLAQAVRTTGWDGAWFRRAVMDDGRFLGTSEEDEAQIWLNTQTWAVLSGMAEDWQARTCMESVEKYLNTPIGIKKVHPPIVHFPDPADPLTNYNPGTGENGAIFCHANTWAVIAACKLRQADTAFRYYRQMIPAVAMDTVGVDRYRAEPYVYSSNMFGPDSTRFGLANVSWLTGTAAWSYIAVTQYLLGIRPVWEGLLVEPCLPRDWKHITVRRRLRGCTYTIEILNPSGEGTAVRELSVDGVRQSGPVIRHVEGRKTCTVTVVLYEDNQLTA